jgi:hypothetical protein
VKWEGRATLMEGMRKWYKIVFANLNGENHFGDLGIDVMIILKCILHKYVLRVWTIFT